MNIKDKNKKTHNAIHFPFWIILAIYCINLTSCTILGGPPHSIIVGQKWTCETFIPGIYGLVPGLFDTNTSAIYTDENFQLKADETSSAVNQRPKLSTCQRPIVSTF